MSTFHDRARRDAGIVFGGLAPVGVAALLVGLRGEIQNANVALVLVLVVVVAAAIGGRAAGLCAAVMSGAAFDFFHTRPYLNLKVANADDIETTVLLIVVGLAVGHIAAGAWREKASAATTSGEIRRIHRIAEEAARGDDTTQFLSLAEQELAGLLTLRDCRFEPWSSREERPRIERNGHVDTRVWRVAPGGLFELPAGEVDLPVRGRGSELGRFVLRPTPGVGVTLEQRVVAVAIADQVGAVLAAARTARGA
ncbi:MAG TPA: DUF4118 domain-containing protein [Acidimicrobiia bacterium]|nr:DUF4118 domain-containing protein [Acidimicrobiia bacterium]